jgi:TetR/AcrR family transcriptional regulator, lmrAB and yxaGH operons repressor
MAQRSDSKSKMVTAARQLFRERGYHATALSDVWELSGTPRGSVYFHFPGGKTQLAVEVAEAYARDQTDQIKRAAHAAESVAELVCAYVTAIRDNFIKSNYLAGCTVAPLVLEGANESDEPAMAGRAAISTMIETLAAEFATLGMGRANGRELAEAVIAGIEGALVTGRAIQSSTPFDAVLGALKSRAAQFDITKTTGVPGPRGTSEQ